MEAFKSHLMKLVKFSTGCECLRRISWHSGFFKLSLSATNLQLPRCLVKQKFCACVICSPASIAYWTEHSEHVCGLFGNLKMRNPAWSKKRDGTRAKASAIWAGKECFVPHWVCDHSLHVLIEMSFSFPRRCCSWCLFVGLKYKTHLSENKLHWIQWALLPSNDT